MHKLVPDRRRTIAWHSVIVVVLAVAAALFWKLRIIDPAGKAAFESGVANVDHFAYTYPTLHRAARMILDGHLPLWNAFQFCGHPFLAAPVSGVLYPLNVPFLLFPVEIAIEVTAALHIFLAGLFMYLYARTICESALAPVVAGLVFMFSGFVTAQAAWFSPAIAACVWLPLGFYAVERIVRRRDGMGVALLALAAAMPILAGWLQTWVYSMYALGFYVVAQLVFMRYRGERARDVGRVALLAGGAVLLGLGVAAPQLLPAFELQRLGPRTPGGLSLDQILVYGPTSPRAMLTAAFALSPTNPRLTYVGALALLVLPLSLLSRAGWRIPALWLLLVGTTCVALTTATPLFEFFLRLPVAGWFRMPERIVLLGSFASAALVGLAIDALLVEHRDRAHIRRAVGVGLVAVVVGTVSMWAEISAHSLYYTWGGGAAVAVALLVRARPARVVLGVVLATVLVSEIVWSTRHDKAHPIHRVDILDAEAAAFDYVKAHQGLYRTYSHSANAFYYAMTPKQGMLRGIYMVTNYEPLSLERVAGFFALLEAPRRVGARSYPFAGRLVFDPQGAHARLMSLMSVRFVLTHVLDFPFNRALAPPGSPWRPVFRGKNLVVYEHRAPLPRAYHASRWVRVASPEETLQAVTRSSFDPTRMVVVEDETARAVPEPSAAADDRIIPATITHYDATRVVIEASVRRPGYLVLTDTFYPGWRATSDGRPVEIVPANYLFRGVWLEPGRHTIVFSYEPLSFRLGVLLCVLSGAVGVAWGARRWRRRRRATT